jgi:hypothetical protein
MQIGANTTGFLASLSVGADKDGRDHCVVVVKGTFNIGRDGVTRLAGVQAPLVYADVHLGDPGTSSIAAECDFARFKPRCDVLLMGQAIPPAGRSVAELDVTLEIGPVRKIVHVAGDRTWEKRLVGYAPTKPQSFDRMPLVYERSFGGTDTTSPRYAGAELRNPVGAGFRSNPDPKLIQETKLPNLEYPSHRMRSWSDRPEPAGFGPIGRGWQPRLQFAGTYDETWRETRFPFLPADFDDQYFQSAPRDQQVPYLRGGEPVRCTNVTAHGAFQFNVPTAEVPLLFRFRDGDREVAPNLDTLIIEPDATRAIVVWRGVVALGRKLNALREVVVGPRPGRPIPVGKTHYGSLANLPEYTAGKGR